MNSVQRKTLEIIKEGLEALREPLNAVIKTIEQGAQDLGSELELDALGESSSSLSIAIDTLEEVLEP